VRFDFPGNVRQLENICHWLTVMAPAQVIEAKDLPPELLADAAAVEAPLPVSAAADAVASAAVVPPAPPAPAADGATAGPALSWLADLERESRGLLQSGVPQVWDTLTRQFEAQLIHTALEVTRGRRIEAAQKLGIGRNTITRKIQELGLDD
jgi:two-component system nitrogen regulation response regulator GlnG